MEKGNKLNYIQQSVWLVAGGSWEKVVSFSDVVLSSTLLLLLLMRRHALPAPAGSLSCRWEIEPNTMTHFAIKTRTNSICALLTHYSDGTSRMMVGNVSFNSFSSPFFIRPCGNPTAALSQSDEGELLMIFNPQPTSRPSSIMI
jgi:hypothetical protein